MIWKYYSLFTHDKQAVFADEKFTNTTNLWIIKYLSAKFLGACLV